MNRHELTGGKSCGVYTPKRAERGGWVELEPIPLCSRSGGSYHPSSTNQQGVGEVLKPRGFPPQGAKRETESSFFVFLLCVNKGHGVEL